MVPRDPYGVLEPGDVPEVATKIDDAVGTFLGSRRFVCKHVAKARVMFLCSQHPRLGLRCPECMAEHLQRHDRAEEFTCDRCRGAVETIHPVVLIAPVAVPVRQARGSRGRFVGRIFVGGVGVCDDCLPGEVAA